MAGFGQTGSNCHLSHFSAEVDDMDNHIYLDLDYQHQNASHSIPCLAKKRSLFITENCSAVPCVSLRFAAPATTTTSISPQIWHQALLSCLHVKVHPTVVLAACLLVCRQTGPRSSYLVRTPYLSNLLYRVHTVATPRASCRIWGGRDNSHSHGNLAAQHIQP